MLTISSCVLSSIKQIVDIVKFYAFVGRGEAAVVEEEEVRVEGVGWDCEGD